MTVESQLHVCAKDSMHFFKDMRSKSRQPGPPWRFWSNCTKCTAKLYTIVSEKVDAQGNITPSAQAWIVARGQHTPVSMGVRKTVPVES